MKKLALLLVALALTHVSWGQLMEFRATLTGDQEVPPRDTPAWGSAYATLDLSTNWFTLDYWFQDLLATQTDAHIHLAPPGVAGPVVIPLPLGSPVTGFATTMTDLQVANLLAGNLYINVHSVIYPGGEIRGQLIPIPEPSTYALAGAAVLGLAILYRRKFARKPLAA